jgi:hypothetical protein
MMDDPIVGEVHETRRRIVNECGGDVERLIERMKAAEVKDADRLVSVEEVEQRRDAPVASVLSRTEGA